MLRGLFAPRIREKMFYLADPARDVPTAIRSPQNNQGIVIGIPMSLLVMYGASRYSGGWHPFVVALQEGQGALVSYYERVRPRIFEEFYHIDGDGRLPPWALPWINSRPPAGEGGLGLEHGVSYYGPVTTEKAILEFERLTKAVASIRKHGYMQGHRVLGHFMKLGDCYRFFVKGGKHRAAALAFLGGDRIPAQFYPGWPRLIDHDQADEWPMVRDGRISKETAQAAFRRYFEFDGTQHLRGTFDVR